jgi:hypothetical protein
MTVTHSKSLTTRRKRQKNRKTAARLTKEADRQAKQGADGNAKPQKNPAGQQNAG